MTTIVGIISDTHGVMRQESLEALKGSQIIIHGGDVGNIDIIKDLEALAPVYAVRGNNDKGKWADKLPLSRVVEIDGVNIYVIHDLNEMDLDPKTAGFDIVISGHSHKFSELVKDEVLYINPGGAGPKRFNLSLTVALLHMNKVKKEVKIKYL